MIVSGRDGRHRSKITRKERADRFIKKWETLSPEEKIGVKSLIEEIQQVNRGGDLGYEDLKELMGMSPLYNTITANHYVDRLADMDEFIKDDYYLGTTGQSLWDKWLADLKEFFTGEYNEAVISGSIGSGKCLAGETEFYDPDMSCRVRLDEVSSVSVAAFNFETGEVECKEATVLQSGYKKLGTLKLASGKEERLSPDHPVLFSDGWGEVSSAKPGNLIATVRSFPEPKNPLRIPDEEVEFIAFMLTEGSCSSGDWSFTNESDDCIDRFYQVSEALWMPILRGGPIGVHQIENDPDKARQFYPRGTRWLQRKYSLYGTSHHKRVPAEFYGLSNEQLALFLNRIWACDGWLSAPPDNSTVKIEIALASKLFIKDIQQLLLRFGIHSRVKKQKKSYVYKGQKKWSWAWRLTVSGSEEIGRFMSHVGLVLGKEKQSKEVVTWALETKGNSNVDVTPVDIDVLSLLRQAYGPISRDKWWPGCPHDQLLGRNTLLQFRDEYGLPEDWNWWPDVFWDEVVGYEEGTVAEPVYDVEVPGNKNFAPGGIIVHNTSWCEFALLRMFYELTMLRDPQSTFGLMPGSEIVLVCFNRDDTLAREVTYGGVKAKLEQSPYFSDIGCKIGTSVTVFPKKNIKIIAVSARSAKALGRNVFGGIIDETDFLEGSSISGKERSIAPGEKPFAEQLHSSIIRRMKSRYDRAGILPGKLMLSSSAKNVDSFTNKRIQDARNEPGVFCRDYAIYDVKPAEYFSEKRFWVLVGNERITHRILSDEEYEGMGEEGHAQLEAQGCKFLYVPENFRKDFERNIEDAVRDIGGIVTVSLSPFIQMREKIYEAIDPTLQHPMRDEVWVTNKPPSIIWSRLCHRVKKRLEFGYTEEILEPIRHPESPRHVHIDLALGKQDGAGLCISHTVDMIDVERRSEDGMVTAETAPLIEVDLLLRIEAPPGGEIDIGAVRGLVYQFINHGFSFGYASMDRWQSFESLQKFRQQGIKADIVSVDKTYEPYDVLKLALYEGRISYYKYPWLIQELEQLERDLKKGQVDHPSGGSKDTSDSLAGTCFTLSTNMQARTSILVGISEFEGSGVDDEWIRHTMYKKSEQAPKQVSKPGVVDTGPGFITG